MLVLLVLAACFKAKPPPKKVEPPPPPDPAQEVRELVKTIYTTLETGDPDPVKPLLAADIMVFGLAPSDTYAQRDPVINLARQELLSIGLGTETMKVRSSRIDVGVGASGQSAWFWDLPRVDYEKKGKTTSWLVRVSGHAVKSETGWVVDAVHVSLGVPDEKVYAPDAAKKYLPPADVLAERGPDSDELVGLSRRILDDVAVKVERLSDRPEVALIGTSPIELLEGGKAIKDLVKPQLAELKKAVFTYKVDGPIRSRLAPAKDTAWVAATVILRTGTGKKQQTLPPFRVLWVFTEEKGLWNLVSEHQSLALKQEMRGPTSEEALAEFEKLDDLRRARNTKTSHDAGIELADAGSPADKASSSKSTGPQPSSGKASGGRVIAASDGGFGTFD